MEREPDLRRHPRARVSWPVTVEADDQRLHLETVNLGPFGAKLKLAVGSITLKRLIEEGDERGVRELLASSPILARTPFADGSTPLHVATGENRPAVVEALVERGAPTSGSIAHLLEQRRRAQGLTPPIPIDLSHRPELRDLRLIPNRLEDYDALGQHDPDPDDRGPDA